MVADLAVVAGTGVGVFVGLGGAFAVRTKVTSADLWQNHESRVIVTTEAGEDFSALWRVHCGT